MSVAEQSTATGGAFVYGEGSVLDEGDVFVRHVAEIFDDVGHPYRLRVLHLLALGVEMSPKEMTDAFKFEREMLLEARKKKPDADVHVPPVMRLGTVAYHVRWLAQRELIAESRTTRVRGALQHHYRPTDKGLLVLTRIKALRDA